MILKVTLLLIVLRKKIEAMSCIVWAQRRVCKRHVTLGHGLEWRIKSKQTQIDLIGTRIRNGLVRRGRSLPSIFAAWLRPTCHLRDFRPFMYKMMHPPPSESTATLKTFLGWVHFWWGHQLLIISIFLQDKIHRSILRPISWNLALTQNLIFYIFNIRQIILPSRNIIMNMWCKKFTSN